MHKLSDRVNISLWKLCKGDTWYDIFFWPEKCNFHHMKINITMLIRMANEGICSQTAHIQQEKEGQGV